ncbi:biosynthetic aromatic amino acid aminotransferase beta [Liquorilactobacillus sucicola DSM 21376 = JCM 15457]|uniref:Histidinol-phosphate aminotransferase n=1 Tax=Liquorilactobacillus sucicola DSM 21376 = JCM 15457 TaxID=1423806 RepID=A0A023CZZ4_9LACO|nr:histidinol-phosphate transaminase [Liquorilactobacillus sucicola]KRN06424.1 histidinol-phosphate aminotransferase [Liquorilactobacillus sucicola DSM 21376 = JCM 15457]GAJ27447.1 biosynthetic aromatic amino acid aminotransferase beta [Liquorilactobacillus sucicola DSM 21376 = JCM 15457]
MKKQIQAIQSYTPEEPLSEVKKRYGIKRLVRLSANENPYGTSACVKEAILKWNFEEENRYPDGYAFELRKAVAHKLNVDGKKLIFGVGLDEIIAMFSRIFLETGDEVLVTNPTFSEYALHAGIEGAKVIKINCDKETGKYNFNSFLDNITSKTKIIWLCNPNNPTGTYEDVADIEEFVKKVPKSVLVLIDEAYIDYVTESKHPSALELSKQFENVAVLRTFSKIYGLANYRVGYAVVSAKIATYMEAARLPYNLSSISQVAALAGLQDQQFVNTSIEKNKKERQKWEKFLTNNGFRFYHSQANFIFFQCLQADTLAERLLKHGYQVRRGLRPDWLRVTIGEPEDNLEIQKIMIAKENR